MRKIVLRLEGGLGNQLFQYAFARVIQEKYGGQIVFDLHTYNKDNQRKLSLDNFYLNNQVRIKNESSLNIFLYLLLKIHSKIFSLILKKSISHKKNRVKILAFFGIFKQEDAVYFNYLYPSLFPVKYISGNWMSEKFFFHIRSILKEELKIKTESSEYSKKIILQLRNENSVCVHIRRGDYTNSTWSSKLLVCDFNYYEKSLNFLNISLETPVFYIFSNNSEDIQWIKENYKFSLPVSYIDLKNQDFEELRLMMNCKHFILSNSSFSWWASYLSENKNKQIVAPSKWNTGIWDMRDIYLTSWHIIDV